MEVPQVAAAPISTGVPDAEQQQTPTATLVHGSATPESGSAAPDQSVAADSTPVRGQNLKPNFEQMKVQKMNKEQLSTQGSSQTFNEITPLTTYLGVFERGYWLVHI